MDAGDFAGPIDAGPPADCRRLDAGPERSFVSPCSVRVPTDSPTIQQAVAASPSPGVVCVDPGTYLKDVILRDGVDLRATGPGVTLHGSLEASALTRLGATITGIRIVGRTVCEPGTPTEPLAYALVVGKGPIRLTLRDVALESEFGEPYDNICTPKPGGATWLWASGQALEITHSGGGRLQLDVEGATVGRHVGFRISHDAAGAVIDDRIRISRSRCVGSQCWDFVDLDLWDSTGCTLPPGSRVDVDIFDNVVPKTVHYANIIWSSVSLTPADSAASRIWFHHNTVTSGWPAYFGLLGNGSASLPIIAANNVFVNVKWSLYGSSVSVANMEGESATGAAAWFQKYTAGDYRPAPGSPLIAAGNGAYGVPIDHDGQPRPCSYDIGAYQRHE